MLLHFVIVIYVIVCKDMYPPVAYAIMEGSMDLVHYFTGLAKFDSSVKGVCLCRVIMSKILSTWVFCCFFFFGSDGDSILCWSPKAAI